MSYATLMVHLDLGHKNDALLKFAGDMAEKFGASVIGIAACQPLPINYADGIGYGGGFMSGQVIEDERVELDKQMRAAEEEFHATLGARLKNASWRSTVTFLSQADYLAQEARAADLFITSSVTKAAVLDGPRAVDLGALVMQIGRPVLVVPPSASGRLDRILVGWTDTRETRRAIADALPLLQQATHVDVVEMAPADELTEAKARVTDVTRWLKTQGVTANPLAVTLTGGEAHGLDKLATEMGADCIVAGAYGHSRLREWVLGGVTRNLLLHTTHCALVSH